MGIWRRAFKHSVLVIVTSGGKTSSSGKETAVYDTVRLVLFKRANDMNHFTSAEIGTYLAKCFLNRSVNRSRDKQVISCL